MSAASAAMFATFRIIHTKSKQIFLAVRGHTSLEESWTTSLDFQMETPGEERARLEAWISWGETVRDGAQRRPERHTGESSIFWNHWLSNDDAFCCLSAQCMTESREATETHQVFGDADTTLKLHRRR